MVLLDLGEATGVERSKLQAIVLFFVVTVL
jgi:hypothetical protein